MDKQTILREIKRHASRNGGKAPGKEVFERHSGVKASEWYPHFWLRWSDAIREAGLSPNEFQTKFDDADILRKYAVFVHELGRIPIVGELRRTSKVDSSFPAATVYNRIGKKDDVVRAVQNFCFDNSGFEDVLEICKNYFDSLGIEVKPSSVTASRIKVGFVYLMKSGQFYKIGRTNALGRRQWELGIKIPIPPKTIHVIETDDPVGIELYWHRRFADRRGEGEWFSLTADDIVAFKRWKKIV